MKNNITWVILSLLIIMITYTGINVYKLNNKNQELREINKEYLTITDEIAKYENIKNSYLLINKDNETIQDKIEERNKEIDDLNTEIENYQTRISELNNALQSS